MNIKYYKLYLLFITIFVLIISIMIPYSYYYNKSYFNKNDSNPKTTQSITRHNMLIYDKNNNLSFSDIDISDTDKLDFVIYYFTDEISNGVNPMANKSFINLMDNMSDDLQRNIMMNSGIRLNDILTPVAKSPAFKTSKQNRERTENVRRFNETHKLTVGDFKDIREEIAEYYLNTPNFSCSNHLDTLVNNIQNSNNSYSPYEFIEIVFVELGRKFSDNPEYVDCIFSYLKSDNPELVYITLFILLTYHHISPEDKYINNRNLLIELQDNYNFKTSAFLEGTTELEIDWYSKEINKMSDKLIKEIDGLIPKYDPSQSWSEVYY